MENLVLKIKYKYGTQGLSSDITHNIEIVVICKKWNTQK